MLPFTRLAVAACLLHQALYCSGGDTGDPVDQGSVIPPGDTLETPSNDTEVQQPEGSTAPPASASPAVPPGGATDEGETPPLQPGDQGAISQGGADAGAGSNTVPPASSPGGDEVPAGPEASPGEDAGSDQEASGGGGGGEVPSDPSVPPADSGQGQNGSTQVPGDTTGDSSTEGGGGGASAGDSAGDGSGGTGPGTPGDSNTGADGGPPPSPDAPDSPPDADSPADTPNSGTQGGSPPGAEGNPQPDPDAPDSAPDAGTPPAPPADGPNQEDPPAEGPDVEAPPKPIPVITVPATSGVCGEIFLSAKGSESNMPDGPELFYTWLNTKSPSLGFVNFLAAQKGQEVRIPKETVYAAAKQYLARYPGALTVETEFTVEVVNKAGQRDTASGTVVLSLSLEPPSLALNSAREFTISKGDSVSLSVTPSFCPLVQSGFDPGVSLQWLASCPKDPRSADELLRLDEKLTTATVRPFSLIPGYTYTVEASIRYTANASLKASQTFIIHVKRDRANVRFQLVSPLSQNP